MRVPNTVLNYAAETALAKFRIVCYGATDGSVKQAAASTDLMIGVTEGFAYAAGDRADIVRSGPAEIEFGGPVTRGQPLTSDAVGRAIAAAPAAGVNARIIGYAEVSGVLGDIGSVYVGAEMIQG
ncbi:DUF2190 family protein [Herbaspirillum rubrisubalbicans]|uniref:DUF2190 domain-containing protein n=1 Tax=Herbaspirillum rubrisubalbicans TaxID=80842 RepID=A0ABX9BZ49_9BURK|nr:DUF2190 family protein [Herbaspirillum rubrisubalbicans]RAM63213.1 hypothetical protein RB24_18040 [Herbaspirillum rubrisubalbicans]